MKRLAVVALMLAGMPVSARDMTPQMGGTPGAVPDRYREGSPAANLPLGVPQTPVASTALTPAVAVVTMPGSDHFNIIAPGEPQWADVQAAILKAVPVK